MSSRAAIKGQSLLGLVLLIGGAVLLIGILIVLFASSFTSSAYSYQQLAIAEAAATSGVEDALLQLNRNPTLNTTYYLTVGSTTASIAVTQNSPSANFITIVATGASGGRVKKLSVVVQENASTSQMSVISWQTIQ
jgi:hypothetical protein